MGAIKTLRDEWEYKKAAWRFRSRKITRAKILYSYFIFSGISMFLYFVSRIFTGYKLIYGFFPVFLLISYLLFISIIKNWRLIWVYLSDMDRGRLLLYLHKNTNFTGPHKLKLVKWVYLGRRSVRKERWLELSEKIRKGIELTLNEKVEYGSRVVACPQQLLDGINKAILINALIYSHVQINVLDDNLRDILDLTPENMNKFDLQREVNKCKISKDAKDTEEYTRKGLEILKKKNNG